jgi:hypothetical protein
MLPVVKNGESGEMTGESTSVGVFDASYYHYFSKQTPSRVYVQKPIRRFGSLLNSCLQLTALREVIPFNISLNGCGRSRSGLGMLL